MEIINKIKHILRYIPGYRSGTKQNMKIATIYYAICLVVFVTGIVIDEKETISRIAISALMLPVILFSMTSYLNNQ